MITKNDGSTCGTIGCAREPRYAWHPPSLPRLFLCEEHWRLASEDMENPKENLGPDDVVLDLHTGTMVHWH